MEKQLYFNNLSKIILKVILSVFLINPVIAQNMEATTTSGQKVILKSNGTWEYLQVENKTTKISSKTNDCNYKTNEIDEFTGRKQIVLAEEGFINYTPKSVKKLGKNREYIQCDVNLAKVEQLSVAYFFWILQTKEAYKYFGTITKESKIIIKFQDNTTLELSFMTFDSGDTNYDLGFTTYSNYVLLDKESIKILATKQVDKVRMYWSKGYEDYPVSDSGIFIRQLPCLD